MNQRTHRRRRRPLMAWLVKRASWARTPWVNRGSRKRTSPGFLLYLPAGSHEGEDLSHTLWNRAEKRRQRDHARALRARELAGRTEQWHRLKAWFSEGVLNHPTDAQLRHWIETASTIGMDFGSGDSAVWARRWWDTEANELRIEYIDPRAVYVGPN